MRRGVGLSGVGVRPGARRCPSPAPGPRRPTLDRVGRMRGVLERPEGLDYRADMLSPDEEREVLAVVERLDLREVQMRGQTARRTVQHFDLEYGYESWQLAPAEPLPESLEWLRERCAKSPASLPPHSRRRW